MCLHDAIAVAQLRSSYERREQTFPNDLGSLTQHSHSSCSRETYSKSVHRKGLGSDTVTIPTYPPHLRLYGQTLPLQRLFVSGSNKLLNVSNLLKAVFSAPSACSCLGDDEFPCIVSRSCPVSSCRPQKSCVANNYLPIGKLRQSCFVVWHVHPRKVLRTTAVTSLVQSLRPRFPHRLWRPNS